MRLFKWQFPFAAALILAACIAGFIFTTRERFDEAFACLLFAAVLDGIEILWYLSLCWRT